MSFWQFVADNRADIWRHTLEHLGLVAMSTLVAVAIGVPLGVVIARSPRLRGPILGVASVLQTIPSLALFGFLIPLPFLGGIGARTAIVALVVYALLPIVRNTCVGITGVDPAVREAAKEQNVPLIDLHAMSKTLYAALGTNLGQAFQDGTHHNNYGSYELAKCIVEGVRTSKLDRTPAFTQRFFFSSEIGIDQPKQA